MEREGQKLLCGSILVVMEETEDCIVSGLATFCQLEVSNPLLYPEEFVQMLGIILQKSNVGTMSSTFRITHSEIPGRMEMREKAIQARTVL